MARLWQVGMIRDLLEYGALTQDRGNCFKGTPTGFFVLSFRLLKTDKSSRPFVSMELSECGEQPVASAFRQRAVWKT